MTEQLSVELKYVTTSFDSPLSIATIPLQHLRTSEYVCVFLDTADKTCETRLLRSDTGTRLRLRLAPWRQGSRWWFEIKLVDNRGRSKWRHPIADENPLQDAAEIENHVGMGRLYVWATVVYRRQEYRAADGSRMTVDDRLRFTPGPPGPFLASAPSEASNFVTNDSVVVEAKGPPRSPLLDACARQGFRRSGFSKGHQAFRLVEGHRPANSLAEWIRPPHNTGIAAHGR